MWRPEDDSRQGLSLNPELTDWLARVARQWAPGISAPPVLGLQPHTSLFGMVGGDLNPGPHSCTTGILLTTMSPAPALLSVHVPWAGHELTIYMKLALNFWSFYLFLPSAGIINLLHPNVWNKVTFKNEIEKNILIFLCPTRGQNKRSA